MLINATKELKFFSMFFYSLYFSQIFFSKLGYVDQTRTVRNHILVINMTIKCVSLLQVSLSAFLLMHICINHKNMALTC